MILLIDNYDSFTFNLVHFLGDLGPVATSAATTRLSVDEALALAPEAIVLSPGPCTPNEAGICLALIAAAAGRIPILGVCLGHQAIGQAFGGEVVRAPVPMHGKVRPVLPRRHRHLRRPAQPVRGHPLPQPRGAPRHAAARAGGNRAHRGRAHHGPCATAACRCSACSSIRRASPASTAIACSAISWRSPAAATLPPARAA